MPHQAPARAWQPPKDTRTRRRILYLRHLLICRFFLRTGVNLRTLGEKAVGCSWTFCPDGLGRDSIIYSGGVGNNISFERELVTDFKCSVHLLDPSPTGVATMELPENRIPEFHFLPVGLAGHSGNFRLAPPAAPEEGSWYSSSDSSNTIEVTCTDLATLMNKNHHSRIDLLKLDIEGAEYGVIEQILSKQIPVRQILVEYHDGLLPGIRLQDSIRSMLKLLRTGYTLIARVGNNHTFLQKT
jgi:FkbM family methyltransferase